MSQYPMNDLRNPLGKAFYDLTQQVEALGGSPELTAVVVAIGVLRDQVGATLATKPQAEQEADCAGGSPCTDCPNKKQCQRGCLKQTDVDHVSQDRKDLEHECNAVDALLQGLGLDPDRCRTEGGALNVGRAISLLNEAWGDKEDASRYRWLCSHMIVPAPSLWDNGVGFVTPALPRKSGSMTKPELDDAIRAARASNSGGAAS